MVICYKCSKILSTQQALDYHLSKKIPCNSIKLVCPFCKKISSSVSKRNLCIKKCKLEESKEKCVNYNVKNEVQYKFRSRSWSI